MQQNIYNNKSDKFMVKIMNNLALCTTALFKLQFFAVIQIENCIQNVI